MKNEENQLWTRRKAEIAGLTSIAEFLAWLKKEQDYHEGWGDFELRTANKTCLSLFVQSLKHQSITPSAADIARLVGMEEFDIIPRLRFELTASLVSNCFLHAYEVNNPEIIKDLMPLLASNQTLANFTNARLWEECHFPELKEILPKNCSGGALDMDKLEWFKEQGVWTPMDLLRMSQKVPDKSGRLLRPMGYFHNTSVSKFTIDEFRTRAGGNILHPQENAVPFMRLLDRDCFVLDDKENEKIDLWSGVFNFLHVDFLMLKRLPWDLWEKIWVETGLLSKDALQREILDAALFSPIAHDRNSLSCLLAEMLPRMTDKNFSNITLVMRQRLFSEDINKIYHSEAVRRGLDHDLPSSPPFKSPQL